MNLVTRFPWLVRQRFFRAGLLLPLFAALLVGVGLWYWLPPVPRATLPVGRFLNRQLYFSPDSRRLAVVGHLQISSAELGAEFPKFMGTDDVGGEAWIDFAAKDPCFSEPLTIWDVGSGTKIGGLSELSGQLESLAFSPDGKEIAILWHGGTVAVWQSDTGKPLAEYRWMAERHWWPHLQICYSPNGDLLAYGPEVDSGKFWDVQLIEEVAFLFKERDPALFWGSIEFRGFYMAGNKETTRAWNLVTRAMTQFPVGELRTSALSADGQILVGRNNGDFGVWHAGIEEHWTIDIAERAKHPALSPDGSVLVVTVPARPSASSPILTWLTATIPALALVTSTNDQVHLLALPDGRWLGTFDNASQASFSPDGNTLAVIGGDGAIRLYDFPLRRPWLQIIGWALEVGLGVWWLMYARTLLRTLWRRRSVPV